MQRDGVHVTVHNRTGEGASINGFGIDVGSGTSDQVSRVAPGQIQVACWAYSDHGGKRPQEHALEILDPEGVWVDPELDCPPGNKNLIESAILDYVAGAESEFTDPVAAARDYFKNLEGDDIVELAGYPEADPPVVRVVRDGRVVATAGFLRADDGGVIVETHAICASVEIGTRL
ncbi:MAG: hypothetical protein M3174_07100 [Actinomycetota bacterium]|nr:hypothetical protein [Actinomycetota bacterium]